MFNVIVNNHKGERIKNFTCPVSECTIGKARDNFIQLRGWKIAPHHAEIHRTSDGLFIYDKTGQARVKVNGKDIEQYGPIRSSDVIVIGGYHITAGASLDTDNDVDKDDFEDLKTVIGVQSHNVLEDSEQLSKTLIAIQHNEKFKWRNRVHEELLAAMDLRRTDISNMDEAKLRKHVKGMIDEIIKEMASKLPADVDREVLAADVLNEAVGLGPLERLLADDSITEIMVNKYDDIYIERAGKLTKSDITFSSDDAVMTAIERIVSPLGRRIDESSPMVDARLKDGSRVNAIIPPLALRGPCLTIRKFAQEKLTAKDGAPKDTFGASSVAA
ncbi:MAG: Flp pilus assembly complex ATPase component TadA, partial [Proteobacteria bacterium]|nr:Flp pilus assembly complex ATPase component TadA [Pseudomonadota bacterium]